jgi:hypothetical protein
MLLLLLLLFFGSGGFDAREENIRHSTEVVYGIKDMIIC